MGIKIEAGPKKRRPSKFDGEPDKILKAYYPTMGSEYCRRAIKRRSGQEFTNMQLGQRAAHLGIKMTREAHSKQLKISARAAGRRRQEIRRQKESQQRQRKLGILPPLENPHPNRKSGAFEKKEPNLFEMSITIFAWLSAPWGKATKSQTSPAFCLGDPVYG